MSEETELMRLARAAADKIGLHHKQRGNGEVYVYELVSTERIVGVISDTFRPLADEIARLRAEPTYAGRRLACSECKRLADRAEKMEAMVRRLAFDGTCCRLCGRARLQTHEEDCQFAALFAPAPPQVFPEAKTRNDFGELDEPPDDPIIEMRRSIWIDLVARIEAL